MHPRSPSSTPLSLSDFALLRHRTSSGVNALIGIIGGEVILLYINRRHFPRLTLSPSTEGRTGSRSPCISKGLGVCISRHCCPEHWNGSCARRSFAVRASGFALPVVLHPHDPGGLVHVQLAIKPARSSSSVGRLSMGGASKKVACEEGDTASRRQLSWSGMLNKPPQ